MERTILYNLSIQEHQLTTAHRTQQEACHVADMNEAIRSRYNYQKYMNQLNRRNIRGPILLDDDDVLQYILSFDSSIKLPLEDHMFLQQQQQAFKDGMTT